MLTLLLMRHAKSSWDETGLSDRQRPLNTRGREDAPVMGRHLAAESLAPHLILCSTAERARQTAQLLMSELAPSPACIFYNELYDAGVSTYVKLLGAIEEATLSPVMIIGHNPTMQAALKVLSGVESHFGTACIACIEFDLESWADLGTQSSGRLAAFWKPKEIHAG